VPAPPWTITTGSISWDFVVDPKNNKIEKIDGIAECFIFTRFINEVLIAYRKGVTISIYSFFFNGDFLWNFNKEIIFIFDIL
jgi:hypothetical protein